MMNKDISIKINRATRMVYLSKNIIGNDAENLQADLVFTFEDDFVEGQARLEYRIDGEKRWVIADKQPDKYTVPVKSVMTKEGSIYMQLVVTEGIDENSVPIFKSNVFYMVCGQSINAELEEPEQYPSWIDIANTKLNRVDNLDIDATKQGGRATITVTKQDKSQQVVEILDGKDGEQGLQGERGEQGIQGPEGPKGDTYVLTAQDKTDIANETKTIVMPDLEKQITLVEDKAGNRITLAVDKNYLMTLKMLNSKGKELSTASVDLPLETMVVNARYDSATKELVIVLENGNELKVPIGDLVKGLVSQTTFDSTVKSLQGQITANNDELNQVVGEVSDAKQDIGLIKQEQTLQNKAIQKNVDDIIATNKGVVKNTARIQNIEGTLYDNGVAEGEFINIKDSALAEQQEVQLGVNKAQITTGGHQLFNIKKIVEGSRVKVTNNTITLTAPIDNWSIGLFNELISGYELNDTVYVNAEIKDGQNLIYIDGIPGRTNLGQSFKITQKLLDNPNSKIYFYTNAPEKPMEIKNLIFSKENVPYEPYTGGIPSPNPNYKQEINKITGSVEYTSTGKNLFNFEDFKKQFTQAKVNGTAQKFTIKGYIIGRKYYLKIKSPITISGSFSTDYANGAMSVYYKDGSTEDVFFAYGNTALSGEINKTITKEIDYFEFNLYKAQVNFDITNFKIEEGTKATPYTPYQAISNTIDLKGNEVLPGDKIYLSFNPMTGKYKKILKKNSNSKVYSKDEIKKQTLFNYSNLDYVTIPKQSNDISYNDTIKSHRTLCNKAVYQYGGGFNDKSKIGRIISNAEPFNYWIGFPKGTTLEEMKTQLQGLEIVYELKDDLKTEINLGEIDIMNMTYYPVTNAFTDKENVLINMKYYRDFANTIRNLQIDKNTLQAQLQDIESRVKALESRPVVLNEPIESEVQNA